MLVRPLFGQITQAAWRAVVRHDGRAVTASIAAHPISLSGKGG